jgi:hypothetical protein
MVSPRRAFDKKILDWCYEERARAIVTLTQIEDGAVRFWEQRGEGAAVEITPLWAERQRDLIHRMNDMIGEIEGRSSGAHL